MLISEMGMNSNLNAFFQILRILDITMMIEVGKTMYSKKKKKKIIKQCMRMTEVEKRKTNFKDARNVQTIDFTMIISIFWLLAKVVV